MLRYGRGLGAGRDSSVGGVSCGAGCGCSCAGILDPFSAISAPSSGFPPPSAADFLGGTDAVFIVCSPPPEGVNFSSARLVLSGLSVGKMFRVKSLPSRLN